MAGTIQLGVRYCELTDLSPIERRVGVACAVAKLNMVAVFLKIWYFLYQNRKNSSIIQ